MKMRAGITLTFGAASLAALALVVGCGGGSDSPSATPTPSSSTAATAPDAPYYATGGFGAQTEGGLGGRVIKVTTLAADGPGSLRDALESAGPRLVVFEVGGVINLGAKVITIRDGDLTVAGQTAPDPGITIIRGAVAIQAHDVVIQHIAVRAGDAGASPASGWEPDSIGVTGGSARPAYNVVIDHCSATWGIDENLSVSGPADVMVGGDPHVTSHDVTLYRCLVAEGLSNSVHSKGEHSKGSLIHDSVYNVAVIGCLYAHNRERNPRLKGSSRAVVVNNLIYNWGSACIGMGSMGNDVMLTKAQASIIGNVGIRGTNTAREVLVANVDVGATAYVADNLARNRAGSDLTLVDPGIERPANPPLSLSGGQVLAPRAAAYAVLTNVGARPAKRDAVDVRIVDTVIQGTGAIIDSQNAVGGYPVRTATSQAVNVPDGKDARRTWLDGLSVQLGSATGLDTAPLATVLR
jgi:hypothetical protein